MERKAETQITGPEYEKQREEKRGAAMMRAEIEAALAWLLRLTRYYEHNPAGQGVGEHRGEV